MREGGGVGKGQREGFSNPTLALTHTYREVVSLVILAKSDVYWPDALLGHEEDVILSFPRVGLVQDEGRVRAA